MGCRCITGYDLVSKEGNPVICGKPDGTGCHDVTTCSRSYLEPIQVPLLERLPERLGRVSGMCVERRGGACRKAGWCTRIQQWFSTFLLKQLLRWWRSPNHKIIFVAALSR